MELKGSLRFQKSPPPAALLIQSDANPRTPYYSKLILMLSPIQLTSSQCPLTYLSYNWNSLFIFHALMRVAFPDQIAILQRNKCSAKSTDYEARIK